MEGEDGSKIYTLFVPNYSNNLLVKLDRLRIDRLCCDVRISTDEGHVLAHKVVMCSASPYFKERISLTSTQADEIHLEDTSYYMVKCLVEFIYTGTLQVAGSTLDAMMQLLHKMQMKDIETLYEDLKNPEENVESIDESVTVGTNSRKVDENKVLDLQRLPVSEDSLTKRSRKRKPTKVIRKRKANADEEIIRNEIQVTLEKVQGNVMNADKITDTCNELVQDDSSSLSTACKKSKSTREKNTITIEKENKALKPTGKSKWRVKSLKECKSKPKNESRRTRKVSKITGTVETCEIGAKEIKLSKSNASGYTDTDKHNSVRKHDSTDQDHTNQFESDPHENGIDGSDETNSDLEYTDVKKKQIAKSKNSELCSICDIELADHKAYLKHMKTHKKGKTNKRIQKYWPCTVCSKKLTTAVRRACHEYGKHGIPYDNKYKLHGCTIEGCKYVTASKHYLQIHMRGRHSNERPHVCEYCGKGFKLPGALVTHLNIHTKKNKFECEECGMNFHQKGGLQIHIKKHHTGEQSWSELCDLCSEKFLHKAELCWHLFISHGQPLPDRYKVFTCDLCDYKTIRKNKLERHMDSHENNRCWVCNVCGKKFVTKSYLNRHSKYHGEKSFVCEFEGCNYACVDKIGLNKHIRLIHTHKNYKPFACTLCTYKTGLRGNLDKHIRTVHNLEVVTKHTVHLKMKFKDRRSGDIITKDGTLIQSASQRGVTEASKNMQEIEADCLETNKALLDSNKKPRKKSKGPSKSVTGPRAEDEVIRNDLTISATTDDRPSMPLHHPQSFTSHDQLRQQQQQLMYLQNQEMNLANHVQVPFPLATNNRTPLTNQMAGPQSDLYISVDSLAPYKYQEF